MARPSTSTSPKLGRATLRESIDAGFGKEHGHKEKDWKKVQHGLNNLLCDNINRIDDRMDFMSQDMKELCEGMQTLLQRSEKAVSPPVSQPVSHRPASRHSTSSHRSVTPPMQAAGLSTGEARLVQPTSTAAVEPRWKAEDIGFFDPYLDASYGAGDLVSVGKDTYYRDVHLFAAQVANIARTKGSTLVAANLHTCLHGTALQWYAALDSLQQIGLTVSFDAWISSLTEHFKITEFQAMQSLLAKSYTIDDVKAGRNPMEYIQSLVRDGKSAGLPTQQQLLLAWGQLDPALMRDIPRPTLRTTVTEFINLLNEKRDVWICYYNRPFPNYQNRQGFPKAPNGWQTYQKSAPGTPPNYPGFQRAIEPAYRANNASNNTSNQVVSNSLNNPNQNPQYESKPRSYHANTAAAAELEDEDESYEDTYQVNVQFNSSAHS
ncbi:hypothetical protein LPUS_08164 [Lasallia pustulata]|uniref:Uncharacterized protein n=1 Tax=Lasallia pustulata TaxID=136370 RepID=A0A1W5D4M1_9LECA|nr:hypothetical protein LPUS_08164 [Lasallia pustulata]